MKTELLDRLEKELTEEFSKIEEKIQNPSGLNKEAYQALLLAHGKLQPFIELFKKREKILKELEDVKSMIETEKDPEFEEFLKKEKENLEKQLKDIEQQITAQFLDRLIEKGESKGIIMEIRAGTGGEEAALFAADLLRMYIKYAEKKGWKVEIYDFHATGLGGYKEVILGIEGKGAARRLKYESGVHRVQRVPVTEAGGRIHTSTATVAILPQVEETEVEIKESDLKIETFRASGPGGQHMQKNETAVRITHIPTGIVVTSQSERSQYQNKMNALKILRARLKQMMEEQTQKELSSLRKSQIGTGERSEKIRTYNFPQNRVTEHRTNLTLYNLPEVLDGDLDPIIDSLIEKEREEAAKKLENEDITNIVKNLFKV